MVAAASVVKDIPDWDTAIFESMRELGRIVPSDAKQDGGCRTTFNPDTLEEAFAVLANAAKLLLVSKQEKYGKDNILTFQHQGLVIRMNDKLQRLISAKFKNVDLGKEGAIESYGDILGYAMLGIALEKGWFTLPLRARPCVVV